MSTKPFPALLITLISAALITTGCTFFGTDTSALDATTGPTFTGPPGSLKSPEQQAGEAAVAKVADYYAVLVRLDKDPNADLNALDTVAAGGFLETTKRAVTQRRKDKIAATGDIKVLKPTIRNHEIPKDDKGIPTRGTATVELDLCLDRSTYNEKRPDGSSPLDPNRPKTELGKPILKNQSWPDPAGWRVTSEYALPGTPCTGL